MEIIIVVDELLYSISDVYIKLILFKFSKNREKSSKKISVKQKLSVYKFSHLDRTWYLLFPIYKESHQFERLKYCLCASVRFLLFKGLHFGKVDRVGRGWIEQKRRVNL